MEILQNSVFWRKSIFQISMERDNKDYQYGRCDKCKKIVFRSEIEKSFTLGIPTKNPLIQHATLPHIHVNCGGIVTTITQMISNQRLLGIDYGSKRIGVALSDESGVFALPHSVIQNSGNSVSDILKICTENHVSTIVVGESKDFEQKDNPIMSEIREFAHDVRNKGVVVIFQPEFMTSQQAERMHTRREESPRLNREEKNDMLDASAAAIILQSYIDTKK